MFLSRLNAPVCFFLSALAVIGIPALTAQQVQFSTAHHNGEHVLSQSVAAMGSKALTTELAGRSGISVTMADFDSDGTPDLVTGYATPGGGALLLQRGSSLAAGQSVEPFVARAEAIDLPVRPNFLKSADIDGRGHADLLVAANGDTTVYLLKGHGDGTFAAPEPIALRGAMTSLTTWRGPSGDNLIVAGVCSSDSCGLKFLAQDGMTKSYVSTGGPATNLETANLNHGHLLDIAAVVNGAGLLVTGDTVMSGVPRTEFLPSDNAVTLTTGSFLYDRRGFAQVAVLGSDAMLHIFARSGVDNTVPTMDEVRANRALDHARGARPTPPQPSGVSWTEVETLPSVGPGGLSPLMIRGRVTAGGLDDLLVFNNGQFVQVSHVAVKNGNTQQSLPLITNDLTASPVTSALAATLTPDVRQGLVMTEGGFQPYIAVPPRANRVMNVNSTADAVPNTTSINACKNGTAGCNLRAAIFVANSDAGLTANGKVDTINLPAGTFTLSANNGAATDVNGDTNIHFDLDGSVNIVGAGSGLTIIDANHVDNIFDMNSGVVVTTVAPRSFFVSGVTLKNGLNSNNPSLNTGSFNYIGGIISWEANGAGYLTMNDVVLTGGKAMWGAGGAVGASNVTPDTTGGVLELDNSTVSNNSTPEEGGGLSLGHNNPLVLNTATISGNSALTSVNWSDPGKFGKGGGVDTHGNTMGATDTITNSTISGNSATLEGGGLHLLSGFTMSGTRVTDNTGGQYGGGLVFESLNTAATVTTSTFTGNSATTDGAGICVRPDSGSDSSDTFTMHFSRIHGNTGTPHNGLAYGCRTMSDTATDTVTSNFTVAAPPTSAIGTVSSTKVGTRFPASATLNVVTRPLVSSTAINAAGGTGSIFLAIVEQLGTSSGRIDLYNVTLGATDTFSPASPASLAVTNSTNEGKPDVDNPLNALFDSSGDLLIGNGGTTTGSPQDNGNVACVPAGAILTGQNSASTVTPNVDDPVGLAYDKRDGSVGISNNPTSSPVQLAEYILNSGLKSAAAARNLTASGYGSFGLTNLPTLTAGTYAIGLTDGLENDPAHNTGKSKITILSPTGATIDITDTSTFSIDIPHQLAWDGTNNQLVIANNSAFHKLLSFYTVSPVALVKTIPTGRRNDKVAVSPDGHVAVSGSTAFGVPQVQVYDGTAARTAVGGPIPFNGTTTSCGSTYIYGSGGGAVNSLLWLSNTKLLIAVQVYSGSNSTPQNGLYVYDITATAVPPGFDDVTCSPFAAAPKQTGFVHLQTKPFAAASIGNGTFAEAAGGSNCGGNLPCYNSITTAIANTAAGGVVNVYGGTFNESVNLNSNVIVNLDANTTVNDFTVSTGTLNLSGGNCGQANGATLTLKTGDWINNGGVFNPGSGTIAFTGTSAQHISGSPTIFYNLTNGNSAGLTLSSNTTVTGILALTSSDITTGTNTLTQPSTAGASMGTFDVVGNFQRTGSPLPNTALTYGNPNNVITLSGGALTSLSVQLTKGSAPASLPKAVQRTYVITPTGSFTSASVQLHYLSGELNGNTESAIAITRFDSGQNRWLSQGAATRDTTNKWVQATGVTQFSTFTFISPPSISSITPNQGKTAGGNNVTITGSYFTSAGGVTIGGNPLTNVSVVSDTQITGTTPAGTIGAASVIVTAAGGSNAANSLFTYIGPPTATNGGPVNTVVNTAVNFTLTAADPNNPAESLSYSYSQPAHGSVTGSGPTVTYTPAAGYQGSDSFTFSVMNSFGLTSNTATESLFVADVAQNQSVSVPFNTAKAITLTGLGTGTETYIVVTNPTHGTLSGTAPNLTYTPTTGYSGADSFTFKINNGVDSNTAAVSITVLPADIKISKSHTGAFVRGGTGTYTITVTNNGPGNTSGTVTVDDTLPAGLTVSTISGTGWTCTTSPLQCKRSDVLASVSSYQVITLVVNVSAIISSTSLTNNVAVSGGGLSGSNNATDATAIVGTDLSIGKSHTGNFTQGQTGATYSIVVTNNGPAPSSGQVQVTDNLPGGLTATGFAGTGWTCSSLPALSCTRSDALSSGSSYPAIALTVNVAANATGLTNSAVLTNALDITPNNTANDPTIVNQTIPPTADTVTGISPGTLNQTLTFNYSSANGFGYLNFVYALFNASLTGTGGCWPFYDQTTNALFLAGDGTTLKQGPLTPGTAGNLSNGQCTLHGPNSKVIGSGNTLSVTFDVSFSAGFGPAHSIYMYALDAGNLNSGWQTKGTTAGSNAAPTADTVTGITAGSLTQPSLVFKYSSANGAGYLMDTYALFNGSLKGTNACWVFYDRTVNGFYLVNDGQTGLLGPLPQNAAATLVNSQCTLNGTGSNISQSGNTLTMNLNLTFTSGFGAGQSVFMYATDAAGQNSGWQSKGTTGTNSAPTSDSVTGIATGALAQTLTFQYSSANGSQYLNDVHALFNSTLNGTKACWIFYDKGADGWYLINDTGTAFLGPLARGSSSTLSNSQCTLNGSGSSVTGAGTALTMVLKVTFSAAFGAGQNIYLYASDEAALNSGWVSKGTTASSVVPTADTVTGMANGSAAQSLVFTYSSVNGANYLGEVLALVNTGLSGVGACWVFYDKPADSFYLATDAGTAYLGPLARGSSGTLTNSQCTLNGTGSTVSTAGNSLTMTLNLTFTGLHGAQGIFLYASDAGGMTSGWVSRGAVTLP